MKIIAIDPGTKKIGYVIVEDRKVIDKGIISYNNFKYDFTTLTMMYHIELCILEKGGVPRCESKIKRILQSKGFKYIEYQSAKIREDLGLFEIGIDNQNKRYIVKKCLGIKEYNSDVLDAALLAVYYYDFMKGE